MIIVKAILNTLSTQKSERNAMENHIILWDPPPPPEGRPFPLEKQLDNVNHVLIHIPDETLP